MFAALSLAYINAAQSSYDRGLANRVAWRKRGAAAMYAAAMDGDGCGRRGSWLGYGDRLFAGTDRAGI